MANPKRRSSKMRRDKRRAHDALGSPSLSRCPECGEEKRPHRVCPTCGKYRGVQVIDVQSA